MDIGIWKETEDAIGWRSLYSIECQREYRERRQLKGKEKKETQQSRHGVIGCRSGQMAQEWFIYGHLLGT